MAAQGSWFLVGALGAALAFSLYRLSRMAGPTPFAASSGSAMRGASVSGGVSPSLLDATPLGPKHDPTQDATPPAAMPTAGARAPSPAATAPKATAPPSVTAPPRAQAPPPPRVQAPPPPRFQAPPQFQAPPRPQARPAALEASPHNDSLTRLETAQQNARAATQAALAKAQQAKAAQEAKLKANPGQLFQGLLDQARKSGDYTPLFSYGYNPNTPTGAGKGGSFLTWSPSQRQAAGYGTGPANPFLTFLNDDEKAKFNSYFQNQQIAESQLSHKKSVAREARNTAEKVQYAAYASIIAAPVLAPVLVGGGAGAGASGGIIGGTGAAGTGVGASGVLGATSVLEGSVYGGAVGSTVAEAGVTVAEVPGATAQLTSPAYRLATATTPGARQSAEEDLALAVGSILSSAVAPGAASVAGGGVAGTAAGLAASTAVQEGQATGTAAARGQDVGVAAEEAAVGGVSSALTAIGSGIGTTLSNFIGTLSAQLTRVGGTAGIEEQQGVLSQQQIAASAGFATLEGFIGEFATKLPQDLSAEEQNFAKALGELDVAALQQLSTYESRQLATVR